MTIIPNFILKRMYVPGSLRIVPEGMAFDIINSLGPGILTRINSVKVGDIVFHAHQILFKLEDKLIQAAEISEQNPAVFFMNQSITCILKGEPLSYGQHTITMDLLSKEAGKVIISVQDHLSAEQAC
jgi:hypothetical protein